MPKPWEGIAAPDFPAVGKLVVDFDAEDAESLLALLNGSLRAGSRRWRTLRVALVQLNQNRIRMRWLEPDDLGPHFLVGRQIARLLAPDVCLINTPLLVPVLVLCVQDVLRVVPPVVVADATLAVGGDHAVVSHNPNSFYRAAELGIDLSLAGHTHGGQIQVEILDRRVNPARFMTNFVAGLYELPMVNGAGRKSSFLYVNRGLGTFGIPVRLGVPPEITLLTLRTDN